jgi:hypothetical protein
MSLLGSAGDTAFENLTRAWKTSSRCSAGGCVEVRAVGGRIEIRDSARPAEVAWFKPADWAAFLAGVRAGEFAHRDEPT